MEGRVNLWQLRAECLRSLGRQMCEASEQQQMETDPYQDDYSAHGKVLEVTSHDWLSEALCVGGHQTQHPVWNAT
jgi:hypothetical protein